MTLLSSPSRVMPTDVLPSMERAMRHTFDVARIQGMIRPLTPGLPVPVITAPGLTAARAAVGPSGTEVELLDALAEAQGIQSMSGLRDLSARGAQYLLKSIVFSIGSCSFMSYTPRVMFIDLPISTQASIMWRWTSAEDTVKLITDLAVFHELGHHVEKHLGYRLMSTDLHGVPQLVKIDGSQVRLRHVMSRHSEECFADAFSVIGAVAAGWPLEIVTRFAIMNRASLLAASGSIWMEGSDYWRNQPWRGIYTTVGAIVRAARADVHSCHNSATAAAEALRAARRGAFPADVLGALEAGCLPDCVAEADPSGVFSEMKALAERETGPALPRLAWNDDWMLGAGDDPTDRLIRMASIGRSLPAGVHIDPREFRAAHRTVVIDWARSVIGDWAIPLQWRAERRAA